MVETSKQSERLGALFSIVNLIYCTSVQLQKEACNCQSQLQWNTSFAMSTIVVISE